MKHIIISILIVAGIYALSWAICVGIMYLISLCFSWEFDILIATGIWLILCFIKLLFPTEKGGAK